MSSMQRALVFPGAEYMLLLDLLTGIVTITLKVLIQYGLLIA